MVPPEQLLARTSFAEEVKFAAHLFTFTNNVNKTFAYFPLDFYTSSTLG